jgi:hypothetical protein
VGAWHAERLWDRAPWLAGRDDSFLRNLFVPDQLLAVNGRNTIGWN